MLGNIFEIILKMSFNASVVALCVILARMALKRVPKKWCYILWSAVGFRLIFPVSLKSVFSIFSLIRVRQSQSVISHNTLELPIVNSSAAPLPPPSVPNTGSLPSDIINQGAVTVPSAPTAPDILGILAIIWLLGVAAMLVYGLVSSVRLSKGLSKAVKLEDNIYLCENISSPFVFGVFRAKIFVPYGLDEEKLKIVIAHEKCHIKRLDHVYKLAAFILLSVNWFNPVIWLSFVLMGKDMEMSCDEVVLSRGNHDSVTYSKTLLSLATENRFPSPCPIAFGESGIKTRIKNALKWKRPGKIIAFAAPLAVLIIQDLNSE